MERGGGSVWFLCLMIYQPSQVYREVHTFPKGISPKVTLIVQLEFELANYNVAVQYASHDVTSSLQIGIRKVKAYLLFESNQSI